MKNMKRHTAVLLHNVRSAHNVGSIFRTADAAGVSKIYLAGYTPSPRDRFGRVQKEIAKTALGAEKSVLWEHVASSFAVMARLKRERWKVIGVEQDAHALDYRRFRAKGKILFVFGNEVRGIPRSLRALCDKLVEIPMHGTKESLNVAVAAGIILFSARQ